MIRGPVAKSLRPYSSVKSTGADMPCVKNYWRCDGADGIDPAGRLIDCKGGAHLTFTREPPRAGVGCVNPTSSSFYAGSATMARPMEILGAGRTMFVFGVWNSTFPDENQLGSGFWCTDTGSGLPEWEVWHGKLQSSSYLQDGDATPNACQQVSAAHPDVQAEATAKGFCITPGGAGFFFFFDELGALVTGFPEDQSATAAGLSSVTEPFPTALTGFGNTSYGMRDLYGFVVCYFDAFPADYIEAASWMATNWVNGHQYLYPGWIGRT